jgi:hypothetical protein
MVIASATYRHHAADCLKSALLVNAQSDRALLTEMAALWLRLAERAELMAKLEAPRTVAQDAAQGSAS